MAIRRRSPFSALGAPLLLAGISAILLNWRGSTLRGFAGSAAVLLAAPTSVFAGIPYLGGTTRYVIVGVTSAVLWMLIGFWAGARSTRSPVCTWSDYWREYAMLVVPMWIGVLAAYGISDNLLQR
jgi:hypothetical protein